MFPLFYMLFSNMISGTDQVLPLCTYDRPSPGGTLGKGGDFVNILLKSVIPPSLMGTKST